MAKERLTENDLKREVDTFREQFPRLADDEIFVAWFLRAFITDEDTKAVEALTGGSNDKGVDAVLIDDKAKIVFIVQGKYREKIDDKIEKRADIVSFAELADCLSNGKEGFDSLIENAAPQVRDHLKDCRNRIMKRDYKLQLYYATLGRCSKDLEKEAIRIVRKANCEVTIEVLGGKRILLLLSDYLEGVAPPVPSLELEMESGQGIKVDGILQRYDKKTDIDSWVFSMTGQAISDVFESAGPRLFARNVRGFLGSTQINRTMEETLINEPEFFWYYNNGITIVCDAAEQRSARGRDILYVENPQIINGQQTTRTLHRMANKNPKASVIVRVTRVPRNPRGNHDKFENIVSSIVSATNWQNAIRPSDLMSNDSRQIEIERNFRKRGYLYLRKRQSRSEAKRAAGSNRFFTVTKEELAQAVAACDLDPSVLRLGKENLFEENHYKFVFPKSDPGYFLNRYWIMKKVGKVAKGYPERAYAKWLVINFMWDHCSKSLKSNASKNVFQKQCEINGALMKPLGVASGAVFNAALAYYRKNRGKGARAIDVSSFFKRKGLDADFQKYWRGSSNRYRNSFKKAIQKFEKTLKELQS